MNWFSGCAAAIVAVSVVAVSVGACSAPAAPSLVGSWKGTITCYSIASPLTMTVDAATPTEATLAQGEEGFLSWKAKATLDAAGVVTVAGDQPMADAAVLTGKLTGDVISGEMQRQLCNSFELKRAK